MAPPLSSHTHTTHTPPAPAMQTLLQQTAVLKLNGGLGTSMGLEKAKSLLVVKDGGCLPSFLSEPVSAAGGSRCCSCRAVACSPCLAGEPSEGDEWRRRAQHNRRHGACAACGD